MVETAGQEAHRVRFGWGEHDLAALARLHDVGAVVVVDVLRFTSAVSVAVSRGAQVLPFAWDAERAGAFAAAHGAELAGRREDDQTPWSLSPTDLAGIPDGTTLVLPSPNGSALSAEALALGVPLVIAGCLRNAEAVGEALSGILAEGRAVAVIAAGERWPDEVGIAHAGPLRPAVEDLLGAGAVLAALADSGALGPQAFSPEARAAIAAFRGTSGELAAMLHDSVSGRELLARGWGDDVAACAELSVDPLVPTLHAGQLAFTPRPAR